MIQRVVIYKGHATNPAFGPYSYNIDKQQKMFELLNLFRQTLGQGAWKIEQVAGEEMIDHLSTAPFANTLLVIPAGESTKLDTVFSQSQTQFLKKQFFKGGGLGYFTCGSAYWTSSKRIYDQFKKKSRLSLFDGKAIGPLCPYPAQEYKVSFFSDAVDVSYGEGNACTIFLNGGGHFIPKEGVDQKIKILARYKVEELQRLKKEEKSANAAILAQIGKGTALLSMFHPYYGSEDFDVVRYEKAFPDCGTDWRKVHARLSPEKERVAFLNYMLGELETFNERENASLSTF